MGRLHDRLSTDLPKVHSYVLDEKRGHGIDTLWRKPLRLMHADAVPFLSDFVVKNIEEAAKCLLLDRPTAAGFHIMRAVERVSREYYQLATGRPTEWKEPNGKLRFRLFGQLAQELQDKADSLQKNHDPVGDLSLISGILRPLCKLYRDPLAHSDLRDLEDDEAMTAFNQGIDAISKMVLDARQGGSHLAKTWTAGNLF